MGKHTHSHDHHDHDQAHGHNDTAPCCAHDHVCAAENTQATAKDRDGTKVIGTLYSIPTMDCAVEESEIRRALEGLSGIRSLHFRLSERTLAIDADEASLQAALTAIRQAGFHPKPMTSAEPATHLKREMWRLGAALFFAVAAEALAFSAIETQLIKLAEMLLAAIAIGLAGFSTYGKGYAALRQGRLNINALMTVAVSGAFLIGQWPEAAMVMALYAIAELIEARSVDRARNAIKGLLDLTPDTAEVFLPNSNWISMPAAEVPIDAIVRVKPGARIPLDGIVTTGNSAVNQAPVTGESIPVDKTANDKVFAGTINETGMIEFRVTAAAHDTTLARIIHAVEQAQGARAPMQRFVDRFAAVYTPSVFVMAVLVAVLTPWIMNWTWTQALYKALVLLVIACPCALVIATPVTVVSGLAAAARRGILIKGGYYLEEARNIRAIALDKTGTITEGKPRLVATEMLTADFSERQVLTWAATMGHHSDHPVSQAIVQGLQLPADGLTSFTALPGRGVQATANGVRLTLGNHRLIEDLGICGPALEMRLQKHEEAGCTVTMLASDTQVLALFAVADTIKESSREALSALHRLGVTSVMLTGDNHATAHTIAQQAGIDDARGNLLPEDKLAAIEDLQRRHGMTAMTGDGINDAPALARADIGVAMGGAGTDTAMEAADIVIMNDDLRRIPETILLSRRMHGILWQNICLALGIKSVFLLLALFGDATMWMAVFADMGASLIVVFNGLRLIKS